MADTIAQQQEQGRATAAAVRLVNLSRHFREVKAVDRISLDIREGEVFTLLGPSGCGKTTTLRMIAGLETPDEGELYFRDRPIVLTDQRTFIPPNKRNVGMVFQSYAIWPHMTVMENVAYPLQVRGMKRTNIRERVRATLSLVGLEGLEDRPSPLLSGGQQQRVALARALVYEPQVLLLDEPFSNLDAKLREQLRLDLKLLQRRLGITVIFVTHDQIEALSLSDRLVVMNDGHIEQMGSPYELYERPASAFVRDFLGRTILLRGAVQDATDTGYVSVELRGRGGALVGRSLAADVMSPGQEAYVAIRPEDVEVVDSTGEGGTNMLDGTVETMLFMGERVEVRVVLADETSVIIYAPRWLNLEEGNAIRLKVREDSMTIWSV